MSEHPVGEQADEVVADLHDDDDVKRRRFGQPLAEAAAQVDDRHDHAAQVQHSAHIFGLLAAGA